MNIAGKVTDFQSRAWYSTQNTDFAEFQKIVSTQTDPDDWPMASAVEQSVLIYEQAAWADLNPAGRVALMSELAMAFLEGPGIIVLRGAVPAAIVDRTTAVFDQIISEEQTVGIGGGDHFAKPGANARVWNAVQKHCLADPENFAAYYASDAIALASTAWLGPGYQVTAQVNRVNPGGAAQVPHRDYHLGFMSPDRAASFPAHIHALSPALTLQGAIAHCDMPVESGPTVFLPHSQKVANGYVSFGSEEVQAYFAAHHVQLPLKKGDAVFFNPALMHGAGENKTSDIYRMANLLQVSSPFGRAIEVVDRDAMCAALYPTLLGQRTTPAMRNAIAAAAEGYAFPTNLDLDPPIGGMAPASQYDRMITALEAGDPTEAFLQREAEAKAKRAP